MFLDLLRRRNPAFLEAVLALHQARRIPGGGYVLDLDAVEANARVLRTEADRLGLDIFAMTKQVGRTRPSSRRSAPAASTVSSASTWRAPGQFVAAGARR